MTMTTTNITLKLMQRIFHKNDRMRFTCDIIKKEAWKEGGFVETESFFKNFDLKQWRWRPRAQRQVKHEKLAVVVRVLQITQSSCCCAEDGKEKCTRGFNLRAEALFYSF